MIAAFVGSCVFACVVPVVKGRNSLPSPSLVCLLERDSGGSQCLFPLSVVLKLPSFLNKR
jgi:hypothetical protein